MEKVILVDDEDNKIGEAEKLEAHKKGKLHRAVSVFIFNSRDELLIHQRNSEKYHSGGLWTNTCCTHPRPGEETEETAKRRLKEEMGIECSLEKMFSFIYKKSFDNGLTEHELDHVFVGKCDSDPSPDKEEVQDWKWVKKEDLKKDISENPGRYTHWFKLIISRVWQ